MARPPFSTTLQEGATLTYSSGATYPLAARPIGFATEASSGTGTRRKPKGFTPPTPYTFSRDGARYGHGKHVLETRSRLNGSFIERLSGYGNNNAMEYCYPYPELAIFPDSYPNAGYVDTNQAMEDRALVKARLAMKRSDLNLGVAFAERNRTAQLVGDTAISLARSLRALRRGQWKQAAEHLGVKPPKSAPRGSIPRKWLEYQYGWKPLLSDVYGATDALARRDAGDWRITGKGSDRDNLDKYTEVQAGSLGGRSVQCYGWRGVFVRIDAVPQNDLLLAFNQLGILNPLLVGWELVPFSFVVDWFLPIGSYLESLDAMLGYGPTTCSISHFSRVFAYGKGLPINYSDTFYTYTGGWEGEWLRNRVRLNRKVSTSVPLPTLPRLKDPRSLTHMANGLSLLATAFSSRR